MKEELGSQLESAKNQNKQNFVLIIGFFLAGLVLVTAYLFSIRIAGILIISQYVLLVIFYLIQLPHCIK